MYVIIAGCHKVGTSLALELAQENHDVVVIDSDPERLAALGSGFNGVTIAGMPIDEDVLRSAGVEQADALAAVTDDDNMNIMVSQVAKELFHVPVIITRVYDPQREMIMGNMGLTTVCPTTLAVQKIKSRLLQNDTLDTLHINGTAVTFRLVKPLRRQLGRLLADAQDTAIFGIVHDHVFNLPDDKTMVQAGDRLVIAQVEPMEE